jgi:hypothetical protein
MPRPYAPPPILDPSVQPFTIGEAEKREIARALKLERLPSEIDGVIATAIANYKATAAGSVDTTVGNTLVALRELEKTGHSYRKAVARLADDRTGVDYVTHNALQPLAKAVLESQPGATEALASAARERIKELGQHLRVEPATESLRHFCGWLRVIFNAATPHLRQSITTDEAWRNCRSFAMEVFSAAGIEHPDFVAHPERLTEYLGTDVSPA